MTNEGRAALEEAGLMLNTFRNELGLNSREFARALGLSEASDGASVRKWERGLQAIPGPILTIVALAKGSKTARKLLVRRAAE